MANNSRIKKGPILSQPSQEIFRVIKFSNGKIGGEIMPLSHPRYFLPPENVPIPQDVNWGKEKDGWLKELVKLWLRPFCKFTRLRDYQSTHKNKVRIRDDATIIWEGAFNDSIETIEEYLGGNPSHLFRVMCSVRRATLVTIHHRAKPWLQLERIKRLRALKYNTRDVDPYIMRKIESRKMPDAEPFDRRLQNCLGIVQSYPKLLHVGMPPEEIAISAINAISHEYILKKQNAHLPKLLRNYISAMEHAVAAYIMKQAKQPHDEKQVIEAVLELFAAHGIEHTRDASSWIKTIHNALCKSKKTRGRCSDR